MTQPPISPIPSDKSVAASAAHQGNMVPDLKRLRQRWSAQFQDLPSFPEVHAGHDAHTRKKKSPPLPELPTLGAMASKAALAMEEDAQLFDRDEPPATKTPLDIPDVPVAEPGNEPSATSPPKPTIPDIPDMRPSANGPAEPSADRRPHKPTLSAMPSAAEPTVSIPLARDQFTSPVTDIPEPEVDYAYAEKPDTPVVKQPATAATAQPDHETKPTVAKSEQPRYTDKDLQEALRPIIEPTVDQFLYTPSQSIHSYLEPMLRSTVRRAIAEQMEEASPFREVTGWDKFAWKMRALISSRTYEDIVFHQTKRYQVEEVYLLRPKTRSLISYASHNPARHAKPNKVQGTIKKIAAKTAEKGSPEEGILSWENNRQLMLRKGDHCVLAAIVNGSSNAILRADLDYALRQAEDRFGATLEEENDIHLQVLQPLLEGCLLIQSPVIPN